MAEYLKDLKIFIISSISSFDIISAIVPNPDSFLGTPVSAAAIAAVNPNGTSTFLAKNVSTFFINLRPTFISCRRNPLRNQPDCIILGR